MKVFVNRKYVDGPWGGGNMFIKNLHRYSSSCGFEITETLDDDVDIIHIQDIHADQLGVGAYEAIEYKDSVNSDVKILHRVNDMDLGRRNSAPWRLDAYKNFSKNCDFTVFVSDWTKDWYLSNDWFCEDVGVIYNGVDSDTFKPADKIKNGKVNLVTHHWSDNDGKGFDIYNKLDEFVGTNDGFTFTYIGRHQNTFKNTKCIDPIFGNELGEELAKYDVYISASEYENCPNHILESISCEIPTYALAGDRGAASAYIVGEEFCYDDWDELLEILEDGHHPMNEYNVCSWEMCIEKYAQIYRNLL